MTTAAKQFILVDDDPLNNKLSEMVLIKLLGDVMVNTFTVPEDALSYIQTTFKHTKSDTKTTIFLDINMPTISGWEFLERFDKFPSNIKEQFHIYMLSSSIDHEDIQRCKQNPLIINVIEKPLSKSIVTKLFG